MVLYPRDGFVMDYTQLEAKREQAGAYEEDAAERLLACRVRCVISLCWL